MKSENDRNQDRRRSVYILFLISIGTALIGYGALWIFIQFLWGLLND